MKFLSSRSLPVQLVLLISAFPVGSSFTVVGHDASTFKMKSSVSSSMSMLSTSSVSVAPAQPTLPLTMTRLFVTSVDDDNTSNIDDIGVDSSLPSTVNSSPPTAAAAASKVMTTSDLKALLPKQKMRFMKVSGNILVLYLRYDSVR